MDETGWYSGIDQASRVERYRHYFVRGGRIDHLYGEYDGDEKTVLRHWIELLRPIAKSLLNKTGNRSEELFDAVVALRNWHLRPGASDPLCALLDDDDDEIRTEAYRVLSQLGVATEVKLTERFWPYVRKGLDDRVAEIRLLMLQSLKFPPNHPLSPDAFESVLCAPKGLEAPVRCMALRVLREFWPERVLKELDLVVALVKDPVPSVRLSVCQLLEWLEVDAHPAILDLVQVVAGDSDSQVRYAAAVALMKIDPGATGINLGPDDDDLRRDFIRGLLGVGEAATAFRRCVEARWRLETRSRLKGLQQVPPELPQVAEHAGQNVYRKRGDEWEVRFSGGEWVRLPDLDGLSYISMLVQKPKKDFTPTELRSARAPERSGADGRTKLGARSSSLELSGRERISHDPMVDKQALKKIMDRLGDIPAEIDKARDKHDDAEVLRLETERDGIRRYLDQVLNPRDKQTKKRNLGTSVEKQKTIATR